MKTKIDRSQHRKALKPSGLNSRFIGPKKDFSLYIQAMRDIIRQGRVDLTPDNQDLIIDANAPFCLEPNAKKKEGKYEKGILLIHGLFDSPFQCRDLAAFFQKKGFLVYAILLPGHGTVPGDLLDIHKNDWIEACEYGLQALQEKVTTTSVCGISLGGTLATDLATRHSSLAALYLFAPAFKSIKHTHLSTKLYSFIHWALRTRWHALRGRDFYSYTHYQCEAASALCATADLMLEVNTSLNALTLPTYMVCTHDDERIDTSFAIEYFKSMPHPKSRCLVYASEKTAYTDPRIDVRTSTYPDDNILDFSHTCLTTSPNNAYYGINGTYKNFMHYKRYPKLNNKTPTLGSMRKKNLKKGLIQRLHFNPDFDELLKHMASFVDATIEPDPNEQ